MIPKYHRFEVNIIQKKFYSDTGKSYPTTAVITFLNSDNITIQVSEYGYLTTSEIYEQISQTNTIDLSNCYVKNFSITAFRRTQLLNKNDIIKINKIHASKAFFDSNYTTDFSFINFDEADFTECYFTGGDVNFSHSIATKEPAIFYSAIFNSKVCDFSNSIFAEGVNFKNVVFSYGIKNFQYTDFGIGEVNFINTNFGGGEILFLNTSFNSGNISFKVAMFGNGKVDFHYSKFGSGDISFERTNFGDGSVDFRKVEFGSGKVNFNRSVFGNGDVTFEACACVGRITFKKATFNNGLLSFELAEMANSEIDLEKATFGNGPITFLGSQFKNIIINGCQINCYLDLRVDKCENIDLSDTVVRDIIDFKPFGYNVSIKTLNLSGMRLLGIIYIDWHKNNVEKMIINNTNTSLDQKAEQFRTLKESFNKAGQYADEDHAYVWFKRFELSDNYSKHKNKNITQNIGNTVLYYFQKLLFDKAGLFATNPARVMFSMLIVYSAFSLLYIFIQIIGFGNIASGLGGNHDAIGIIGRSFFFSGVTFFTIGYGDFYPMGIIRVFALLEGFTGVFLMSYFTVAFVRKILR